MAQIGETYCDSVQFGIRPGVVSQIRSTCQEIWRAYPTPLGQQSALLKVIGDY